MIEAIYVIGVALLSAWSVFRTMQLTDDRDSARRQAEVVKVMLDAMREQRDAAFASRDQAWARVAHEAALRHTAEARLKQQVDQVAADETPVAMRLRSRR